MTDTDIIKDANRYRWLRDRSENVIIDLVSLRTWENVAGYKTQLDNLIDNELASASAECLQMAEVITDQREWVGLTEQEHTELAIECGCLSADWVFYGAAVERKLKDKNGG